MQNLLAKNTALLVVDVQKGLNDPSLGNRNNPHAEKNIALLLAAWRQKDWPVVHVKHCSVEPDSLLRPGLPGNEIQTEAQPAPGEAVFSKTTNSAFIGTDLENFLHKEKIESLVVVGLTTDHCISTSVRMAANLGFDVILVSDATATHDRTGHDGVRYTAEQIHQVNLISLNGEFCQMAETQSLLQELN
ncbi:MAG: cysteine hydrolase [Gammaproteobacteria bacterium]|nr:cysteine hydrolase [Gammaproteobacteria bacterium]